MDSIRAMYQFAQENKQIIGINQTQPHKSNPVMKELFANREGAPINIDAIVKDESGNLVPFDLNGDSFRNWFVDEVGIFTGQEIILVGIGGVGEPIARRIVEDMPQHLYLVDPIDKTVFASEIGKDNSVTYVKTLSNIERNMQEKLILINAAGKEGVLDDFGIQAILEESKDQGYIFVDLRPHLSIAIVEKAKNLGWQGFTGYGMNARNDYTLLVKMSEHIPHNDSLLSFWEFKELVTMAS